MNRNFEKTSKKKEGSSPERKLDSRRNHKQLRELKRGTYEPSE